MAGRLGQEQISNGGGSHPVWSPKEHEIYFLDRSSQLNAAEVQTGPTFAVGDVRPLFDASQFSIDPFHQSYDVTPDGGSFIFSSPRQSGARTNGIRLVWVNNWFTDLQARIKQ